MLQTIEAVIDKKGRVHLLESIQLKTSYRALVTILSTKEENKINELGGLENLGVVLDDDLENASREIGETFRKSIENSIQQFKD